MEINVTKETFKSLAKKQHAAMKARNVELKLSDIQESLAIAYGYENLATLYAVFQKEEFSVVDARSLLLQTENQFVLTWLDRYVDGCCDEVIGVFPPGTTLEHLGARGFSNLPELNTLHDCVVEVPGDLKFFAKDTVALKNYAHLGNVSKYGLDDAANEATVNHWVKCHLGFRVPAAGVQVSHHELGDDSASKHHFLVWVNDEDSARIRALFVK